MNDRVIEFDIDYDEGTVRYRAGVLDAFKQLYVAKRLAPILKGFAVIDAADPGAAFASSLDKFLDAISGLKDEDLQFIISTCLSVASKQDGKTWVRLTATNGALMFEDMNLVEMLTICFHVVKANLAGFTRGLPSSLKLKLSELGGLFSKNIQTAKVSSGAPSSPGSPG
jgi:hypothetical protein